MSNLICQSDRKSTIDPVKVRRVKEKGWEIQGRWYKKGSEKLLICVHNTDLILNPPKPIDFGDDWEF